MKNRRIGGGVLSCSEFTNSWPGFALDADGHALAMHEVRMKARVCGWPFWPGFALDADGHALAMRD